MRAGPGGVEGRGPRPRWSGRGGLAVALGGLAAAASAQPAARTAFARMDVDGDGALSRQEFQGPGFAFRLRDRNRDGRLSLREASGTPLLARHRAPATTTPQAIDALVYLVRDQRADPTDALLAALDQAGVGRAVLAAPPQAPGRRYRLVLDDLAPAARQHPDRLVALGGAYSLNRLLQEGQRPAPSPAATAPGIRREAEALLAGGARGFGEVALLQLATHEDVPFLAIAPDHPLVFALVDVAAHRGVPLLVRMEAVSREVPRPGGLDARRNPARLTPNLPAFERLLAQDRRCQVLWTRLGDDATGQRTPGQARDLLRRHPNLTLGLRVPARRSRGASPPGPTALRNAEGRLQPAWAALLREFPRRFVLTSGALVLHRGVHPRQRDLAATAALLQELPSEVRAAVGWENAERLFRLAPPRHGPRPTTQVAPLDLTHLGARAP